MSGPVDMASLRNILVIRRRGLGDALVSLPAVAALAETAPDARIDLLIDRPFVPLLERAFTSGRVVPWPPVDADAAPWRGRLSGPPYDLVLDLLSTPRTALWTALSGARLRVGYDLPWRRWAYNVRVPRNADAGRLLGQFAGESFLDPLRALGLEPGPWTPAGIGTQRDDGLDETYRTWRDAAVPDPDRDVALVLSAGWPAKAWPTENAADFVATARQAGVRCILIPGPGDEALTAALVAEVPDLVVAPPTGLVELADLLSRCRAYVGTDGGARHVAASLGRPTCTLFGPTDPSGWNREHPDHVAVRTGEECSPCDLRTCPVPGHPCMSGLTADAVWKACGPLLGSVEEEER